MPNNLKMDKNIYFRQSGYISLVDPRGGAASTHPPNGTQFFRFHIHFCQKVPRSEVSAPGAPPPPTGNPGSATAFGH